MTDGEYRFFREYIDDDDIEYECDNPKLSSLKEMSIIQMSENEYEFFKDFIFDCDTINPCNLKQYIEIINKTNYDMTNNEFDWYKDVKDECEDYIEKNPSTKHGKIVRRMKQITLYVFVPFVLIGMSFFAFFLTGPTGPE